MNSAKNRPVTKYRPVLTAAQILHIITLAKSESPISTESIGIVSCLVPFQAKIQNAAITPAYTMAPAKVKAHSLESLGGMTEDIGGLPTGDGSKPKEEYWEICYFMYKTSPTTCTLQEIQAAREHMYLNDLMTPEEMVEFEAVNYPETGE